MDLPDSAAARSPNVFFFDRPSRAAIALASKYEESGALIVFEPSANAEPALFEKAAELAHIVKYSDDRLAAIPRAKHKNRLEIQTRGALGLRFRRGTDPWKQLPALGTTNLADSAGAGDWCTAGLLSRLASRSALAAATGEQLADALRYGQALAAWNCGFEGARGGMYARSKDEFAQDIAKLIRGSTVQPVPEIATKEDSLTQICPACPPPPKRRALRKASGA